MPEGLGQWFILLLAVAALVTVFHRYLKSRHQQLPHSARNDVKARRLWQGDPRAYERKYGDIDRQLDAKDAERAGKK